MKKEGEMGREMIKGVQKRSLEKQLEPEWTGLNASQRHFTCDLPKSRKPPKGCHAESLTGVF